MQKWWVIAVSMSFQPTLPRLKSAHPSTSVLHPEALPSTGGFARVGGREGAAQGPVALFAALALAASAGPVLAAAAVVGTDRERSGSLPPGARQRRPLRRAHGVLLKRRVRHRAAALTALRPRAALSALRFAAPDRGLRDVEALRSVVRKEFLTVEESLRSRRPCYFERLLFGGISNRALEDLRVMWRTADKDMDRLQLALLRGDPLLHFLRGAWLRARGIAPAPIDIRAELSEHPEAAVWLRGQVGQQDGLDPVVVASVVGRVKHDPNLVERLAAEAMERQGRDAHASGLLAGLKEARRQKAQSWLLP